MAPSDQIASREPSAVHRRLQSGDSLGDPGIDRGVLQPGEELREEVDRRDLRVEFPRQHEGGGAGATADVRNPEARRSMKSGERYRKAGLGLSARALARSVLVQVDQQFELVHVPGFLGAARPS